MRSLISMRRSASSRRCCCQTLTESPRARSLTRRRLGRTPWPIGAKAEPADETRFFYDHLFSTAPELVAELDARIDSLPGQSGLSLIRKAARL